MSERRKFTRVNFTGLCSISVEVKDETKTWQTELFDISLNGALVSTPVDCQVEKGTATQLNLHLEGSDIVLEIAGNISHLKDDLLGIQFLTLSLDSITHLKRLIQLNIGDESSLHREISQLINIGSE